MRASCKVGKVREGPSNGYFLAGFLWAEMLDIWFRHFVCAGKSDPRLGLVEAELWDALTAIRPKVSVCVIEYHT